MTCFSVVQIDMHPAPYVAATGSARLRPELQGQPKIAGFVGPCWGGLSKTGEPIIRYEDRGTYAALSQ